VDAIAAALAGELALLEPSMRASRAAVDAFLHPNFAEIGQSGRWWTREETLVALPAEPVADAAEIMDMQAHQVAPGIVLVTYRSRRDDRVALRSSLWVEHNGQMRVRWHQGTPAM
jgi:ribonuclease HI